MGTSLPGGASPLSTGVLCEVGFFFDMKKLLSFPDENVDRYQ
jgi:hypothetical protein